MKTRDDDNEELEIRDLNAREVLYAESKVTRCHETVARVYDLGAGTPGGQGSVNFTAKRRPLPNGVDMICMLADQG